jgi:hypothetical protein
MMEEGDQETWFRFKETDGQTHRLTVRAGKWGRGKFAVCFARVQCPCISDCVAPCDSLLRFGCWTMHRNEHGLVLWSCPATGDIPYGTAFIIDGWGCVGYSNPIVPTVGLITAAECYALCSTTHSWPADCYALLHNTQLTWSLLQRAMLSAPQPTVDLLTAMLYSTTHSWPADCYALFHNTQLTCWLLCSAPQPIVDVLTALLCSTTHSWPADCYALLHNTQLTCWLLCSAPQPRVDVLTAMLSAPQPRVDLLTAMLCSTTHSWPADCYALLHNPHLTCWLLCSAPQHTVDLLTAAECYALCSTGIRKERHNVLPAWKRLYTSGNILVLMLYSTGFVSPSHFV